MFAAPKVQQMQKKLLERSVDVLLEKAEDCMDLAKSQRASADKQQEGVDQQHAGARKLEELSNALVGDAVVIRDELEMGDILSEIALKKELLHSRRPASNASEPLPKPQA